LALGVLRKTRCAWAPRHKERRYTTVVFLGGSPMHYPKRALFIALCRAPSPPAMRWNAAYWLDDFCDRRIDFMGPRGTPDISPSMRSCISTKHAPGRRRLAHLAALIRGGKVVMILLSRCSREQPKSDDLSSHRKRSFRRPLTDNDAKLSRGCRVSASESWWSRDVAMSICYGFSGVIHHITQSLQSFLTSASASSRLE